MRRIMRTGNERGLTLVEILASLVILGIVFVAFMTIFPQMTLFNDRTETKLETMNEAKIQLEQLKKEGFNATGSVKKDNWYEKKEVSKLSEKRTIVYQVKIEPDVTPAKSSQINNEIKDNLVTLHQAIIKIYKNEELISETFGYVQIN